MRYMIHFVTLFLLSLISSLSYAQSVQVNTGHNKAVNAVAAAPNGEYFVTAADDASLRLWSIADRCLLRILAGHAGFVNAVVISPDSQTILSAGNDNTLRGWNSATGLELFSIPLAAPAFALAITPGGQQVAVAMAGGKIGFWKPGSTTVISRSISAERGRVTAIAFNPDGNSLLAGSQTGAIWLLNAMGESTARNPKAHRGPIRCVGFGPDGLPFSGGEDKWLYRWPASLTEPVQAFYHSGWVTGAAFLLASNQLLTVSNEGQLRRWNLKTASQERATAMGPGRVSAVAFLPGSSSGNSLVATGGFNGTVGLYNVTTGQTLLQTGEQPVRIVAMPSDSVFVVSGLMGAFSVVIRANGLFRQAVSISETPQPARIMAPGGQRWQTLLINGRLRLISNKDTVSLSPRHHNGIRSVSAGPGGLLFTGGEDGKITVWNGVDRQPINVLTGHTGPVLSLAFDPVTGQLLSASADNTVRLWNPATGEEQTTFVSPNPVVMARFSPNTGRNNPILLLTTEGRLRALDRQTRQETHQFMITSDEPRPDWLMQTTDGGYEGTKAAVNQAYIVQGFQKHPLNPARQQPGLLQMLLGK